MSQRPEDTPAKASLVIADELRRRIMRGELLPGDALPPESELVHQLGYSKPTVREALRILENEGLIRVKRGLHGGPEVQTLSLERVAQPMGIYLHIYDVPISDVWASRDRIIAAALERLASLPAVDLTPLETEVEILADHVGDLSSFYLHMISTAETAVETTGSATDHVVVTALRHIVAGELAAATEAATDRTVALAAEEEIVAAWREALSHVRGGRGDAARAAFDRQAAIVQSYLEGLEEAATVGEALSATPEQRVRVHARISGRADRRAPGRSGTTPGEDRTDPLPTQQ
jgi:GntR family transcriptional regulator, transcriptional repressor for pyruvate dehydrogenase complex